MINMRYGREKTGSGGGVTSVRLGRATADGTMTLTDSLANYQFVIIATYFGSEYAAFDMLPVAVFENPAMPIHIRIDTNNTYRHVQLTYASDTAVTVSNRSGLNVDLYGVKFN